MFVSALQLFADVNRAVAFGLIGCYRDALDHPAQEFALDFLFHGILRGDSGKRQRWRLTALARESYERRTVLRKRNTRLPAYLLSDVAINSGLEWRKSCGCRISGGSLFFFG